MFMTPPAAGMNLITMRLSGVTFIVMAPLAAYGRQMAGLKSIASGAMIFVGITTGVGKMRDIDNPILWHEAEAMFIRDILPDLIIQETKWQGGKWQHADECLRSEEWNNWTDSLCKSGRISDWQYENWSHPSVCDG